MYRVYQPGKFLDFAAGKKQLSDHFDLGTFPLTGTKNKRHSNTGLLQIILTAEAVRRLHPSHDPKMIPTNLDAPMQLSSTFRGEIRGRLPIQSLSGPRLVTGISPIINAKNSK